MHYHWCNYMVEIHDNKNGKIYQQMQKHLINCTIPECKDNVERICAIHTLPFPHRQFVKTT